MAWIDNINQPFKITTGEGSVFSVLWRNPSKSYDFNLSQFEFIDLAGTLIDRRQVKGASYPIEIYIQGENHLVESLRFDIASKDPRAWTMEHPIYGQLTVQPVALQFDNAESLNYTKITGTVIETITANGPAVVNNPTEQIEEQAAQASDDSSQAFLAATPSPADMTANAQAFYEQGKSQVKSQQQAEEYFNLLNESEAAILNATSEPLAAIRSMQALIEAPARWEINVQNRLTVLTNQFTQLANSVQTTWDKAEKLLFENNAGPLVSAMALAAGLPLATDYRNRADVIDVINTIIANYNQYVSLIDSLQVGNGGAPGDYNPNAVFQTSLNSLVNLTISSLFNIALNARQERAVILAEDDNMITLAHRFYGPSVDDDKILEFKTSNNIGLSEILGLRKGRRVIYYV